MASPDFKDLQEYWATLPREELIDELLKIHQELEQANSRKMPRTQPFTITGGQFSHPIYNTILDLFRNKKVLEICAGSGIFFRMFKQQGMDIVATDIRISNQDQVPDPDFRVKEMNALDSVKSIPHNVLLAIHPMCPACLDTDDYLTNAITADEQSENLYIKVCFFSVENN